jgi:UDP-glucose 4-epimerase
MKRVLITGGCGFVGVNLAAALTKSGAYQVRVIDNESLGKRKHLDGIEAGFVLGDIRNRDEVRGAMQGCEAVVHLAADTRVIESIEDPQLNFDTNVIGTFNVLEVMRELGVSQFVNASTGGAILGEVDPPAHERMLPQPMSPYGASKLAVEGYCSAFSASYGLHAASLRFSNVYGPRSFHKGSVVAHFYKQILKGEPLVVYGDGSQVRDYVYVEDLCDGIISAIERNAAGVFQLGTGIPTTLNELIDEMRPVTGMEFEVQYEPARAGEVHTTWCDISKAREGLGFNPDTPLATGLAETWNWFTARADS